MIFIIVADLFSVNQLFNYLINRSTLESLLTVGKLQLEHVLYSLICTPLNMKKINISESVLSKSTELGQ